MAKTINELKSAAAVVRDATEDRENTALRIGQLFLDAIETLGEVSTNAIKGFAVISSTDDLPTNPTSEQQQKGYLLGTVLYVYVGTGGDTLDGKYKSADIKGPQGDPGEPGADGHDGVDLGEVALINDLTTGGEGAALSAEMGKTLAGMIPTVVNDLTTGGEASALSAEQGKILNATKAEGDHVCASTTLADAIAEVASADRKVGLVIAFNSTDGPQRYKYMGKYYTDTDWLSTGAWLDLNNADKYNVYYFRLCPSMEGSVANASINTSGVVTTGSKNVTDYIAIPEGGVRIGGGFLMRYSLYDSSKALKSTAILYGGSSFTYSATNSAYIRLEYESKYPNWKFGYLQGGSGSTPDSLPHVEVLEIFENIIDYNDDAWAKDVSPLVRLRKGERLNLLKRYADEKPTSDYLQATIYDINQQATGRTILSTQTMTMPVDGYATFGSVTATSAQKQGKNYIISKSVARTRAKKRLLVSGDSISVYTWDNTASADKKQGYPFFIAIDGDHDISVTNIAVSGNTASNQLTALQGVDLTDFDAVTIFIGTNDYGYNSTVATFKTNLTSMVEYIISSKPSIKIGLMTLIHRSMAWNGSSEVANAAGAVLSEFVTAIKEVAQTYGLPVLDLWNECQCNFNFSTYVLNYSSHESNANGDGTHPTNEAHKLFLYPLVREFLKKLLE